MEYFYDDYSGLTMLKAGVEDFEFWYGDKAYRQFGVVSDIQQEVLHTLHTTIGVLLEDLAVYAYAEKDLEYYKGVSDAMRIVQQLFQEIDEKDLTPDDDSL